jgi:hypothetical protein
MSGAKTGGNTSGRGSSSDDSSIIADQQQLEPESGGIEAAPVARAPVSHPFPTVFFPGMPLPYPYPFPGIHPHHDPFFYGGPPMHHHHPPYDSTRGTHYPIASPMLGPGIDTSNYMYYGGSESGTAFHERKISGSSSKMSAKVTPSVPRRKTSSLSFMGGNDKRILSPHSKRPRQSSDGKFSKRYPYCTFVFRSFFIR